MKKADKIINNIKVDKEIMKNINKIAYTSIESFIESVQDYIKATKENRMFSTVSYSNSGSVKFSFHSCEKNKKTKQYWYRQYYMLFKILGYRESKENGKFTLSFGNMDMIFNTNYNNVHKFFKLGFINKKQLKVLCQNTPVKM